MKLFNTLTTLYSSKVQDSTVRASGISRTGCKPVSSEGELWLLGHRWHWHFGTAPASARHSNKMNGVNLVKLLDCNSLHIGVLKPGFPTATCLNLVQHKYIPGLWFLIFPGFPLICPTKLRWLFKVGLRHCIKSGGIFFFRPLTNQTGTQQELFELLQAAFIHQKYRAPLLRRQLPRSRALCPPLPLQCKEVYRIACITQAQMVLVPQQLAASKITMG